MSHREPASNWEANPPIRIGCPPDNEGAPEVWDKSPDSGPSLIMKMYLWLLNPDDSRYFKGWVYSVMILGVLVFWLGGWILTSYWDAKAGVMPRITHTYVIEATGPSLKQKGELHQALEKLKQAGWSVELKETQEEKVFTK